MNIIYNTYMNIIYNTYMNIIYNTYMNIIYNTYMNIIYNTYIIYIHEYYIYIYGYYIYIYEYNIYIYMNIIYMYICRYFGDGTQLTGQSYPFPVTPPNNRSFAMHKGWNGRNDCSRNSNSKKRQPYNSPWIVETTEGQKSNVLSDASKTCPSLQQGISILKSVEKKRQLMKT